MVVVKTHPTLTGPHKDPPLGHTHPLVTHRRYPCDSMRVKWVETPGPSVQCMRTVPSPTTLERTQSVLPGTWSRTQTSVEVWGMCHE